VQFLTDDGINKRKLRFHYVMSTALLANILVRQGHGNIIIGESRKDSCSLSTALGAVVNFGDLSAERRGLFFHSTSFLSARMHELPRSRL
jgi:hypothetical protein